MRYGRGQRRLNAAERSCQLAQPGIEIDASLAHRAAPASWARRTMLPIVSWLISIEFDTGVASPNLYGISHCGNSVGVAWQPGPAAGPTHQLFGAAYANNYNELYCCGSVSRLKGGVPGTFRTAAVLRPKTLRCASTRRKIALNNLGI
jgi:hypothetical protein